jgi:hypothetical protein
MSPSSSPKLLHSHLQENRIFHRFAKYLLDIDLLPVPWKEANGINNMLRQALANENASLSLAILGPKI